MEIETNSYRPPRSIFHTHEPRDTMARVHVLVLFFCLMTALSIAIIYAETNSLSATKSMLDDTKSNLITANRSNR